MLGFVAWLVLLAATVVLAQLAFQFDLARIVADFLGLSPQQQAAIGLAVLVVLSLMAFTLWQSWLRARPNRSPEGGRSGLQRAIAVAGAAQKDFDAAVQHLLGGDPEETISSLDKQLGETEARAALQRGRNRAVDMPERLAEIRRRQQALREQIGELAERRRVTEPLFEELKDRQRQLERSLDKVETDDNDNNFGERLKEFDEKLALTNARHKALQDSFAMLGRFKMELTRSQAELVPLQAPEAGIKALLAELNIQNDRLAREIEQLEVSDGEEMSPRVEALENRKKDAEQRMVRLEASYGVLDTIRRDFTELRKRQEDLGTSFAEIEFDSSGKSLADRLAELEEFSAQTRVRLRSLQESMTTLNRFRRDLVNSQTQLAPLQAPEEGIKATIEDLDARRAQLIKVLDELENSGDEKLGSQVETFAESTRATEQRIAQVFEHFERLDSLRSEIARTFANLNTTLNKLG
jgi:chromosome segregation ATPase